MAGWLPSATVEIPALNPPAPQLDQRLFREVLTAQTSADDWSRWFKDLHISLTPSEILLEAPSRFVANQVVTRFLPAVEKAARTADDGTSLRAVRVTVNPGKPRGQTEPSETPMVSAARLPEQKPRNPKPQGARHPSNHHRFDNFEVGSSNLFAYAAASAVAENPGTRYNPLFIYGSSGLGKSHLLHAIAHSTRQRNPELAVRYCSSEAFVQQFIQCVGQRQMGRFRQRFRQVDMLVLDDFQFLEGKQQTLEEFYWTFDSLHQDGKQIVLGCDRRPRELPAIQDRIRSRISAGLLTEIAPPAFETRLGILHRLEKSAPTSLGDEVLCIIANHVTNNIRDLVGAMHQLTAYSKLTRRPLTPDSAFHQLAPLSGELSLPNTPETIMAACAEAFHTTVEEILHHNRRPIPSLARQVAMYLTREITGLPFARIGVAFNRGHSTVLSAYQRIVSQISSDKQFAARVTAIHNAIYKP